MEDQAYLDKKYFIDEEVFNCPFCNRNNVAYRIHTSECLVFDWKRDKKCYIYIARCTSCEKVSMHLSFQQILDENYQFHGWRKFKADIDIDAHIFYSVPTSFFVIDSRIPNILRELITEAEGCLKMNFLTGASACIRKVIYELLIIEAIDGDSYQERIKALKRKYQQSDEQLFDILAHIQDMTSDKIHEQSWDKWDSSNIRLIAETLRTVLYDIYVLSAQKKDRSSSIQKLLEEVNAKSDKTKP